MTPIICWTVTEGAAGMESQARGVAEAVLQRLPGRLEAHHIRLAWPWRHLPARLAPRSLERVVAGPGLTAPWPDLVVSCGRQGAVAAAAIRLASRQRGGVPSVAVHIQDPKLPLDRFDLVVAPAHDRLRGANVLTTQTAVHHLTRDRLDQAAGQAPAAVLALPRPLVAVLLGGPNRYYRFDHKAADGLAAQLAALAESGAGLVITPSRRTPADAVRRLRRQLPAHGVHLWDGTPPNPYAAILGQADAVMVTCDSVSMISEATASGRPVWLLDLPRRRSDHRFRAFHQAIIASGMVHRWQGRLETWTYAPPDETGRVADAVADRLRQRSQPAAIAQATGDG